MLFDGARKRLDGWYRLGLWIAWHTAALSRTERFPALDTLLTRIDESESKSGKSERMDWRAMKSALKAITSNIKAVPKPD